MKMIINDPIKNSQSNFTVNENCNKMDIIYNFQVECLNITVKIIAQSNCINIRKV